MVDTKSHRYSFIKKKEIKHLMNFISKNWKKKHILSTSQKLLKWQHSKNKKELNFFAVYLNNQIVSVLGIIDLYYTNCKNKKIGLALWCSNKSFKNYGGILFKKFLEKSKTKKFIATGLNELSIKYYKYFKFNIVSFKKFYICSIKKKQVISKNLKYTKPSDTAFIQSVSYINFYNVIKSKCRRKYIKKRYQLHPFYKYMIIKDKRFSCFLIYRVVKIKKCKFIRVVDFEGSFNKINLGNTLAKYCIDNNFEHIEFLYFGLYENLIKKSGFNLLDEEKDIMPILTEPYVGLKETNIIIAYKNLKKISIVKGDVDADRPNSI